MMVLCAGQEFAQASDGNVRIASISQHVSGVGPLMWREILVSGESPVMK